MKIYTTDLLKMNLHLGKWKKIQTYDSQYYFFNRHIFKINELTTSLIQMTIFLNMLLKSKNKLLFLGGNPYTSELLENLAVSNQQYYTQPWGFGLYSNTKLYKIFSKKTNNCWFFKPAAVILVDPTGVDLYYKEINSFKVPTIAMYNVKSTYSVKNSFITFNTVNFYAKFLNKIFSQEKYSLNFYKFNLKKIKLLKKFKKKKSKKVIFLNKIRFIRVRVIRKKWFKVFLKKKYITSHVRKNNSKKISTKTY